MTNPLTNGSTPAFIAGIADADYRNARGLAQSSLKEFLVSPAHYLCSLDTKPEPTKAMQFGTAFHAELLQQDPSQFYAVKEKVDGRTKEGKTYNENFAIENAGKVVIDTEEASTLKGMRESVMRHPLASELMKGLSHKEVAAFANYGVNGETRIKGLMDGYSHLGEYAIDLKTAEDASPAGFRKAIWDRAYDLQQVHYTWLLTCNNKPITKFYFIVVEKKPPFAVGVYTINKQSLAKTQVRWENAIQMFGQCQSEGVYPAYSESEVEIVL